MTRAKKVHSSRADQVGQTFNEVVGYEKDVGSRTTTRFTNEHVNQCVSAAREACDWHIAVADEGQGHFTKKRPRLGLHTLVCITHPVKQGEELLMNYGSGYWESRTRHPNRTRL